MKLPSPLWGGVGGGGISYTSCLTPEPPPTPSPSPRGGGGQVTFSDSLSGKGNHFGISDCIWAMQSNCAHPIAPRGTGSLQASNVPATSKLGTLSAAIAALLLAVAPVHAQSFPTRQLTFVVPFAAGGPVDNVGRVFAEAMRRQLGAAVIVDNRPGAGGIVGSKAVASAKPDGYVMLIGSLGPLVIAPAAGAATVDADTQLSPIGLIAESPQILAASTTVKAETLREFIAFAKASGSALNYGSAGIGTVPHLSGEMLKAQAGIDLLHVPYRGTGAALPDLISGRNQVLFGDITSLLPMVESGRVRAYAITSVKRSELAPNVPTTAEAGMPDLVSRNWNGLLGPTGLPPAIVTRLTDAMRASLKDGDYLAAMRKQGATPVESSPEHLARYIAEERRRLAPIIKSIGLKLE